MALCNGDALESIMIIMQNGICVFAPMLRASIAMAACGHATIYSGIAAATVPQETHVRPQLKQIKQHENTSSGIAAAACKAATVATQKQHERASSGIAAAARPQ